MLISGQYFQTKCKWNLDKRYALRVWKSRLTVRTGDTVFLKLEDIPFFLRIAPFSKVILVFGNSDMAFTDQHYNLLKSHALRIYAVNCQAQHAIPIPLGFIDPQYSNHALLHQIRNEPTQERTIPVLLNFLIATNRPARMEAYTYFKDKAFCVLNEEYMFFDYDKSFQRNHPDVLNRQIDFYRSLKRARFAICPIGNGVDTHRIYECLYFGVIPIVKTSFLDRMYSKLPIWIVQNWSDVTEDKVQTYIPFQFENLNTLKGTSNL